MNAHHRILNLGYGSEHSRGSEKGCRRKVNKGWAESRTVQRLKACDREKTIN